MSGTRVAAMIRKEFLHIRRDFRSLYMAICIPLILLTLFGYALKLDVEKVKTSVLDLENSPPSRELISRLTAARRFELTVSARNYEELHAMLAAGTCHVAIVIPPDFSAQLNGPRKAVIQVLVDGSNSNRASIIIGYLEGIRRLYNLDLQTSWGRQLGMLQVKSPVDHRMRIWFNEELESKNFIIPGLIAVIMMLVGCLMTSLIIVREWELGTMETLLSIPIEPLEIVLGKIVPYFTIGLLDLFLIIGGAHWIFQVPRHGSLGLLIGSSALFLFVALSLGIFISSVSTTQLMANNIATMGTFLPAFLLSGFIFPIANMALPLQMVSQLVPARYFVSIVHGVYLRGSTLALLWPNLLALALFGLALNFLTLRFGRQKLD